MSTSGTVGQTVIDVVTLCEHIARRCGVQPNQLGPEHLRILKNVMFFFMTSLSNRGVNLWRLQRGLFGLDMNQATYTMPAGTLDCIKALYRVPQPLDATITSDMGGTVANLGDSNFDTVFTQTGANGSIQYDFTDPVTVNLVGLLAGSASALTPVFEASADAVTWTPVRSPGVTAMTDGKWKWFNIEPASTKRYFRVRETGGSVISLREVVVAQDFREYEMYRMNRDQYAGIPEKRFPGEPRQFWFDRQSPSPQMIVWPVPDDTCFTNCVSVWLHMQCQDVGQLSGQIDIPQRWYEAFVANCAFSAILDLPGADLTRYDMVKDQAQSTGLIAEGEERDNSPIQLLPNIGPYTS